MRPPPPSLATVSESALRSLGWFVGERQRIWHRRFVERLTRPWTTDLVLAERHFTNVFRWLDPGTAYALEALRDAPHPLWFVVAYRGLNRRATFENYGRAPTPNDRDGWLRYLAERRTRGAPVVLGRHRTPSRSDYVAAIDVAATWNVPSDARSALTRLRALRGYGPFLAWQACADLLTAGHVSPDDDLVVVSQGSAFAIFVLAGLLRPADDYAMPGTYARPSDQRRVRPSPIEEESFNAWVRWLRDEQTSWLPANFGEVAPGPLTVIDVEHALCEWGRWVVAWHERSSRDALNLAR